MKRLLITLVSFNYFAISIFLNLIIFAVVSIHSELEVLNLK